MPAFNKAPRLFSQSELNQKLPTHFQISFNVNVFPEVKKVHDHFLSLFKDLVKNFPDLTFFYNLPTLGLFFRHEKNV